MPTYSYIQKQSFFRSDPSLDLCQVDNHAPTPIRSFDLLDFRSVKRVSVDANTNFETFGLNSAKCCVGCRCVLWHLTSFDYMKCTCFMGLSAACQRCQVYFG